MTDHKESPSKETDRLSRAWPEGVLPTRGEQLAGLIVLDQCGLVSRERWHRWAETQAVVDRALGAAEPFTAGMDGDFHAWRVRRCEAVGVAVTATSEEGEELARQCLYHEAFEFYDALRRPTPLLETLAAQPFRAFTRGELVERAFGDEPGVLERTVDAHVMNLRRRIEPDPARPVRVVTVFGVGYRFEGVPCD